MKNNENYIDEVNSIHDMYIKQLQEQDKIINNLQSKIDKANETLDKLEMQPAYLDCKYYELEGFKELKDILKEDK